MRTMLIGMLALVLAGCGARYPVQVGPQTGWGYKTVQAKEEPATLVALDESTCTVTPARFQRVNIGDRVTCHWQRRGGERPMPGTHGLPTPSRQPTAR
jgi:hypothetical protein